MREKRSLNLTVRKVLIVSNLDLNILLLRRTLIETLLAHGVEVGVCVPPGRYRRELEGLGVRVSHFSMARGSMNPLTVPSSVNHLHKIIKQEAPDIVHSFTHQPNIFVRLAAPKSCTIVHTITGLGSIFMHGGPKGLALRSLFKGLYMTTSPRCRALVFQNDADRDYFVSSGLTGRSLVTCIRGSGVDIKRFRPGGIAPDAVKKAREALGLGPEHVVCTLSARLLYDKGVLEFVSAARALKESCPKARFLIVGKPDHGNPKSLTPADMARISENSNIVLAGWRDDMETVWGISDVAVLPSYREGLPMSLQEALSCGLPVVATDVPGCREILAGGNHGFLVPFGDAQALEDSLRRLLQSRELRETMGAAARKKAVRDFAGEKLALEHIDLYQKLLEKRK